MSGIEWRDVPIRRRRESQREAHEAQLTASVGTSPGRRIDCITIDVCFASDAAHAYCLGSRRYLISDRETETCAGCKSSTCAC